MPWDFELYHASKRGLIAEGVPPDIAEQASKVIASETAETERTPQQQEIVTRAWRYVVKLPPEDGAVLGNARQTTND